MKITTLVLLLINAFCSAQLRDLVQVRLQSNTIIQLDTFTGTIMVMDQTLNCQPCLTPREQEIILLTAERLRFFSLPDSVHQQPDVTITGNTGVHILRIKTAKRDKSVVWFEPTEKSFKEYQLLRDLQNLIVNVVASKPDYYSILRHH